MRLEFERTLIRPIVQAIENADFPADLSQHSRYMTLFTGYGVRDLDTRRCSLLEYGGRPGRAKARRVLEEAKDQLQPTSLEYALLRTWAETFNDVCAVTLDAPPQFEALVWPAYKRAMCDPGYYFSPSELWLFAIITQTPVVFTLFKDGEFTIIGGTTTGGHARKETVFLSLGDDGSGRVRGHFERIWQQGHLEAL